MEHSEKFNKYIIGIPNRRKRENKKQQNSGNTFSKTDERHQDSLPNQRRINIKETIPQYIIPMYKTLYIVPYQSTNF